jgi:hypothetical protein
VSSVLVAYFEIEYAGAWISAWKNGGVNTNKAHCTINIYTVDNIPLQHPSGIIIGV